MIRGNLATRPFYNERPVRLALAAAALLVIAATLFNLTQALGAARADSTLATAASQDEARARDLAASARTLRASVNPEEVQSAALRARQANDLIDRRTFSWTELFNRLEATLPPDVRITAIRPQLDPQRGIVLTISLVARSVDDIDAFMEQLDGTGAFQELLPRTERVRDTGLLEATLEGVYRPAAADRSPATETAPAAAAAPPAAAEPASEVSR